MLLAVCLLVGCKSQTKEEMVHEGEQLIQQGNPLGAIVLLNSALEKDSNYVEARYQLGLAYMKGGKLDKAEKELRKVRLQDPGRQQVRLDLASIYIATQRLDEAFEEVSKYEQDNLESSLSREYVGRIQAMRNDFVQAEQSLLEAIELDAKNVSARLALVQVYMHLKWDGEARSQLAAAIKASPRNKNAYYMLASLEGSQDRKAEALAAYRQVNAIDANDVGALYMTGMLSLDSGDAAVAQRIADDLRKRFASHPAGPRLAGMIHYVQGDYESAANELRISLQEMSDLGGYYFLGLTEYRLERYELALNQFQRALDIYPGHVQSRLMVSMTMLRQGRVDDCIYQIQKVLQGDDQNAMAHNIIGSAYLAKGEYDRAMEHLDRAIGLDPSLADAHMKKGLFNLSRGDNAGAEIELSRAVDAAPEVLNTRFLLASLYLRQQNFTGATKALQEGLEGTAEDALLYNYLAAAYFAQKKPDEAVLALEKAKAAKPDFFAPYFNLANYYMSIDQRQKAVDEYQAVLKLDPKQIKALISLAALQEILGDSEAARAGYQSARNTGSPEGFLAQAGYLMRNREEAKVAEVVESAYVAYPAHPGILELRGRLQMQQKKTEEAVKMFQSLEKFKPGAGLPLVIASWLQGGEKEKALSLARQQIDSQPDAGSGYLLMAAVHQNLGATDKAEAILKQGIAAARDASLLSLQLGAFYAGTGRTDQAIETLSALQKAAPNFVQATFALGAVYDQAGNKRKAVDLYRDVLAKAEGHTAALNNLAYLYAENYGSPDEGLVLAIKAFRNEPTNPGILDTLGYVLLKNGRVEEAVNVLNKAAELLPNVAAVRLHQGQALMAAGKSAEARQALQATVESGKGPEAEQASRLLDSLK
ncbi:XrtA/PEP-CTERM system TPR-repeat protein PrsT [Trichloromonas sp.]|uniref:XrtA/PEP-CTERM system TPR-repeat protein PrsT n=1 Tax=Trichloromonas sp. TaxID=3069249 RepID=UPI003D81533A